MALASKLDAPALVPTPNWSLRDAAVCWMCMVILVQSVFVSVPQLDIGISQLFFDGHFYLKDSVAIEKFRHALAKTISLPAILALVGILFAILDRSC